MEKYLEATDMLNYCSREIVDLVNAKKWNELNDFDRIGAIYQYVQNNILFGYNKYDDIMATQVLDDGIGQCNTKATLLMALLRAVGVPCRLHGTRVAKVLQCTLMPKMMAKFAPSRIIHTWAEVYYNDVWLCLEGVITDKAYIAGLQKQYSGYKGKFMGYGVAVKDFSNLQIDWKGENTTIQQQAVIEDLGVFDSPDEFYSRYRQDYQGFKKFVFENIGRKKMTKKVAEIRYRT